MTAAVQERTLAQVAALAAQLLRNYDTDRETAHAMADHALAGNPGALRAWRKWATAATALSDGGGSGRHAGRRLDAAEIAALTAAQQEARGELLEAVAVPADVDFLRRASRTAFGWDPMTWRGIASWFLLCASSLETARSLAACPNWAEVDYALDFASVVLRENRVKVTLR